MCLCVYFLSLSRLSRMSECLSFISIAKRNCHICPHKVQQTNKQIYQHFCSCQSKQVKDATTTTTLKKRKHKIHTLTQNAPATTTQMLSIFLRAKSTARMHYAYNQMSLFFRHVGHLLISLSSSFFFLCRFLVWPSVSLVAECLCEWVRFCLVDFLLYFFCTLHSSNDVCVYVCLCECESMRELPHQVIMCNIQSIKVHTTFTHIHDAFVKHCNAGVSLSMQNLPFKREKKKYDTK